MIFLDDDSVIVTCSSGLGFGNTAVSLIRISGFQNLDHLKKFFSNQKFRPRVCEYSLLLNSDGSVLDEILYAFFPSPKSYTGENVLELHVHGNQFNVAKIINFFKSLGMRDAKPGEFTFRALKNRKLTLSQVEGLDLLLNANSDLAHQQGLKILNGELFHLYQKIQSLFLQMRSAVEILIDFSDDVGDDLSLKLYHSSLKSFSQEISSLHHRLSHNSNMLLHPKIVLYGDTNAGKSTLFNYLLQYNRSIVSPIAGTTRDYVSEEFSTDQVVFTLLDTAGVRKTTDEIEHAGIKLTSQILKDAFFRILVINPFLPMNLDERIFLGQLDMVVFTHSDQEKFSSAILNFEFLKNHFTNGAPLFFSMNDQSLNCRFIEFGPIGPNGSVVHFHEIFQFDGSIGPEVLSGSIGPVQNGGPIEPHFEFLFCLKFLAVAKFHKACEGQPILVERQAHAIQNIHKFLTAHSAELASTDDLGLLSDDVRRLGVLVSELLGITSADDVLAHVFSNFCIGK